MCKTSVLGCFGDFFWCEKSFLGSLVLFWFGFGGLGQRRRVGLNFLNGRDGRVHDVELTPAEHVPDHGS